MMHLVMRSVVNEEDEEDAGQEEEARGAWPARNV